MPNSLSRAFVHTREEALINIRHRDPLLYVGHQATWRGFYTPNDSRNGQTCSGLTGRTSGLPDSVIRTLRRLDSADFPYGLRVTVTAEHTENLPESIEYICAHFRPQRVMVEPAYQLGRWASAASAETEAFVASFRLAKQCAARFGRELFYSGARLGALTSHFCGVSQDAFALSPDGGVSGCYEAFSEDLPLAQRFFYGKPNVGSNDGYQFDLAVLGNLRKQAVHHRDYCNGCFARWTCGGDCFHKALTVSPNGEFVGSERCHITRELTRDQIMAKIVESGGLFWHEGGLTGGGPIGSQGA